MYQIQFKNYKLSPFPAGCEDHNHLQLQQNRNNTVDPPLFRYVSSPFGSASLSTNLPLFFLVSPSKFQIVGEKTKRLPKTRLLLRLCSYWQPFRVLEMTRAYRLLGGILGG